MKTYREFKQELTEGFLDKAIAARLPAGDVPTYNKWGVPTASGFSGGRGFSGGGGSFGGGGASGKW